MKQIKYLIKHSPFIIIILILLNPILKQYGVLYLHYFFILFISIILFFEIVINKKTRIAKRNLHIVHFFIVIGFIAVVNLLFSLSTLLLISNSLVNFLLIPFYWALYIFKFEVRIKILLKLIVYIAIINGFIALVQLFVDPNIFNIYEYSEHEILSGIGFRPSALLGSPQVYGLFMVLSSIVSFEINKFENNRCYLYLGILLIILAVISGNKSVLFSIFIYFLFKLFKSTNIRRFLSFKNLMFVLVFIIGLSYMSKSNYIIEKNINRVALVFQNRDLLKSQEKEGRLKIYSDYLNSFESFSQIIVGQGIGSVSSLARGGDSNKIATESFILLIMVEYGVIILFFYLYFWIKTLSLSFIKKSMHSIFIINFVLFLSLFFVHAFAHPVFFVFWPVIYFPLFNNKLNISV